MATRQVGHRDPRAHATAIAAELKKLWPTLDGSNAEWTSFSLAALAKLGEGYGFESSYSPKCGGQKECLWDLVWRERDPATRQIVGLPLVGESEWTASKVQEDFEKLLYANAPLRLMIFEHRTEAEVQARFADLERWSRAYRHPVAARYLAAGWVNRNPQKPVSKEWEVG